MRRAQSHGAVRCGRQALTPCAPRAQQLRRSAATHGSHDAASGAWSASTSGALRVPWHAQEPRVTAARTEARVASAAFATWRAGATAFVPPSGRCHKAAAHRPPYGAAARTYVTGEGINEIPTSS